MSLVGEQLLPSHMSTGPTPLAGAGIGGGLTAKLLADRQGRVEIQPLAHGGDLRSIRWGWRPLTFQDKLPAPCWLPGLHSTRWGSTLNGLSWGGARVGLWGGEDPGGRP